MGRRTAPPPARSSFRRARQPKAKEGQSRIACGRVYTSTRHCRAPDPSPRLRFVVISERGQRNQERAVPRRLGSVRARRGVFAIFIAQHPRRRRALTPASGGRPTAVGVGTCATLMGPRECWIEEAGPAPAESRPRPPPTPTRAGARNGGGPRQARARTALTVKGPSPEVTAITAQASPATRPGSRPEPGRGTTREGGWDEKQGLAGRRGGFPK